MCLIFRCSHFTSLKIVRIELSVCEVLRFLTWKSPTKSAFLLVAFNILNILVYFYRFSLISLVYYFFFFTCVTGILANYIYKSTKVSKSKEEEAEDLAISQIEYNPEAYEYVSPQTV